MSDSWRDNSISVIPVEEGIIISIQVVTDLRETRTALVNWMPGGGGREGERERMLLE